MSTVGSIPPNLQTLAPSYAPLGKPAAGLESPENKDQTLPPVEETSASEKNRNQPRQKVEAASPDDKGDSGKSRRRPAQSAETEQQELRATAPVPAQISNQDGDGAAEAPPIIAQAQLEVALQRTAALHAEHVRGSVSGAAAVDSFNANSGHAPAPGSLLDQRS